MHLIPTQSSFYSEIFPKSVKKDTVLLQGKRFEKHFVWKNITEE